MNTGSQAYAVVGHALATLDDYTGSRGANFRTLAILARRPINPTAVLGTAPLARLLVAPAQVR